MTAPHLATLRAIVATFAPSDARVDRVTQAAAEAIDGLSPRRRAELAQLLDLLALPMRLPLGARAALLRSLADSPVAKLRTGFAALKRLTLFLAYAEHDDATPNPTWSRLGYPGAQPERVAHDVAVPVSLAPSGATIDADVVVIGSGAGGGTAAAVFARAGRRVVVLEAGPALDATTFPQSELALGQMYLEGGLAASEDLGIAVLAGATLGGGTTVNWCTSFALGPDVAAEWERQSGITDLGARLEPHYAALGTELDLAPAAHHNRNNAVIVRGAERLGVHAAAMPRNAPADCGTSCGWCGFGCATARKRSTPRVMLPAVIAAGGAIYADARALRIEFSGSRAQGVSAVQTGADGVARPFTVRAPLVVCAAGTLRTPGLLARSGITHPLLGARLFLHPVGAVRALMDEPVEAWSGAMQSAYSDAYGGAGLYGAKIETAPVHPGLAALSSPWTSARDHAERMNEAPFAATLIAVTRDRDPGRVSLDDEATIRYTLSPFDGAHLLAGIVGMAELAFAAGAREVSTLHHRPIVLKRDTWNAAAREAFAAQLQRIGIAANRQPFFSAHQMGTASLGAAAATSVCTPEGAVRGTTGVLVADGSLFPLASGVNPMLTIMALARHVATSASR